MLHFVLVHRELINDFTAVAANGLRKFELIEDEWEIVESICDVLEVLKEGTLLFSKNEPRLADVIPVMDVDDDVFSTMRVEKPDPKDATRTIEKTLSTSIQASMALGRRTLNKYYRATDDSEVYRIAMVLHPEYKLKYFRDHNWEESWIDEARTITRARYDACYANRVDLLPKTTQKPAEESDTVRFGLLDADLT
ncbi:hypothetical protein BDZ89DRAFT_968689 [Hymenopellis radicata]|nr:hypothetical protein BDZ89DRAFT_968689 [Hymenopellis radicata]